MTHETVRVELGARSYDIEIGSGLLGRAGALITPFAKRSRLFVVTDAVVGPLHIGGLNDGLRSAGFETHVFTVPAGEASKSFANLTQILDWLLEAGAARDDVLVALGGGVVGDLAGFAASILKRGMAFVQVPTTLLAQVDSSVGGKTAINARQGKNLIGSFYQPRCVIADLDTLATLPDRQVRAGLAEVVKYALIDDFDLFDWLSANTQGLVALDLSVLQTAVASSCRAKARIVAQDEREGGVRALLNLGHTFAHALEASSGYGPQLLHGEAVGCGMALAFRYSVRLGLCAASEADAAEALLRACGLVTHLPDLPGGPFIAEELIEHMKQDKKARGGQIPLILARGIGKSFIRPDTDLADLTTFLESETGVLEDGASA